MRKGGGGREERPEENRRERGEEGGREGREKRKGWGEEVEEGRLTGKRGMELQRH